MFLRLVFVCLLPHNPISTDCFMFVLAPLLPQMCRFAVCGVLAASASLLYVFPVASSLSSPSGLLFSGIIFTNGWPSILVGASSILTCVSLACGAWACVPVFWFWLASCLLFVGFLVACMCSSCANCCTLSVVCVSICSVSSSCMS